MRAKEFVSETKGKITKRQQNSTRGLHTFTDTNYDRTYTLNRVMMAVASANGIEKPVIDSESWIGKRNSAHPYTEIEQKMLKDAYSAVGVPYQDMNNGNLKSEELPNTHIQSPLKPFKGYKKK